MLLGVSFTEVSKSQIPLPNFFTTKTYVYVKVGTYQDVLLTGDFSDHLKRLEQQGNVTSANWIGEISFLLGKNTGKALFGLTFAKSQFVGATEDNSEFQLSYLAVGVSVIIFSQGPFEGWLFRFDAKAFGTTKFNLTVNNSPNDDRLGNFPAGKWGGLIGIGYSLKFIGNKALVVSVNYHYANLDIGEISYPEASLGFAF